MVERLKKWTVLDYFLFILLVLLAFVTAYPFYQVLLVSFSDPGIAQVNPPYLIIRKFSLNNYMFFFVNTSFLNPLLISVARTVIGALCSTVFTALFSFAMAKKNLFGRKLWMTLMLIPMYISGGLIPYFIMIKDIGLYQNFLVFIMPALFSPFNAIILITFFSTIPASIEESAKIDGANEYTIFFRIIIRVSMPVLATIILFNAVSQWNSWFDSMLFGGEKLVTLQARLVQIIRNTDTTRQIEAMMNTGVLIAGYSKPTVSSVRATAMAITALPIIMVYPFLQKYFIKGVMIGSLKG